MRFGNQNKIGTKLESLRLPYRKEAVWEQLNNRLHKKPKHAWLKYAAILFSLLIGSTAAWFITSQTVSKPRKPSATGIVATGTVIIQPAAQKTTHPVPVQEASSTRAKVVPQQSPVPGKEHPVPVATLRADVQPQLQSSPNIQQSDQSLQPRTDIPQLSAALPVVKTEVLPKPRYRVVHANELYQPAGKKPAIDDAPSNAADATYREAYAVRKKRTLYIFTGPSF